MSLYLMELAPSSWFITHDTLLRSKWWRDVVQVEYLPPDFVTESVKDVKFSIVLPSPLKWLVLYGWAIVIFPLMVQALGVGSTLLDIVCLLLGVAFIAFYVALSSMTTSANDNDGFKARDLLKCSTLSPFWDSSPLQAFPCGFILEPTS